MVFFVYNGYGFLSGHRYTFGWASDTGASVNFDEYGWLTFNINGYGENDKITAQLGREYGRFFCSTNTCGGFSDWLSGLGSVTVKVQCETPNASIII